MGVDFDWDAYNITHIAEHGVEPEEAEEAVLDEEALFKGTYRGHSGERRTICIGATSDGRVLFVVVASRRNAVRVVTARDATGPERAEYRRK